MTGTVLALREEGVSVRREDCGGCFGCAGGHCAPGVLFTAENRDRLPLKPGQRVEIETPRLPLLKQTLGAILPLFPGFAGGWALGGFFLPGEAGRALAGVLGLFAAGAGVYLLRRRFPVKTLPRIRRALIS